MKNKLNVIKVLLEVVLIMAVIVGILNIKEEPIAESKEIEYSTFIKNMESENYELIVVSADKIIGYKDKELKSKGGSDFAVRIADPDLVDRMLSNGIEFRAIKTYNNAIFSLILTFIPIVFLFYMFRRMKPSMSVGGSDVEKTAENNIGIRFSDVAGADEAKESLMELVDFLHNPKKYNDLGARLPKGALLVGPPGTGKTLLAKAIAGEAKVPFYSVSGSEFVELFVGVGAGRVRSLFKKANETAPCIIFIDEIDAIGKKRDGGISNNDEREHCLNQLLAEMDGFDAKKGIIVIGATNRPEILDQALLRPGRFDRHIIVDKPDLKGREEILKVHLKKIKCDETVDIHAAALATAGAAGADLENMVNEAAIMAAKENKQMISQKDLNTSIETVLVGKEKKNRVLSEKEKKIVSYHEIGHALVAALVKNKEPIQKITIVPRTMGALGYVMQVPEEECFLQSKEELLERITICLAGRAAEEVCLNTITTGASNDIEQATEIARAMVTKFGMNEKFGLMNLSAKAPEYLNSSISLSCGENTASEIDNEINRILMKCYENAKGIIFNHMNMMDKLAGFLLEHETITGKEFMEILNGNSENEEQKKDTEVKN